MKSMVVKSDFTDLHRFVQGLGDKHIVKVGIFSNRAEREEGPVGNPDLGAIHEFGSFTKHIPARSFLQMPIMKFSNSIVKKASVGLAYFLAKGNMISILKTLGIACEEIVERAFATSGFGQWPPLKDPTRRGKNKQGTGKPLLDTRQLSRSIASQVGMPS